MVKSFKEREKWSKNKCTPRENPTIDMLSAADKTKTTQTTQKHSVKEDVIHVSANKAWFGRKVFACHQSNIMFSWFPQLWNAIARCSSDNEEQWFDFPLASQPTSLANVRTHAILWRVEEIAIIPSYSKVISFLDAKRELDSTHNCVIRQANSTEG